MSDSQACLEYMQMRGDPYLLRGLVAGVDGLKVLLVVHRVHEQV